MALSTYLYRNKKNTMKNKVKISTKKCLLDLTENSNLPHCVCSVLPIISLFFKENGSILSELVTNTNLMSKFYETFFVFYHSTTSVCVCQKA